MIDDSDGPEDRELFDALATLPVPQATAALSRAFGDRLRARSRFNASRRLQIIAAIAATLLVAVTAGWWFDRSHELHEIDRLSAELANLPVAIRFERISAVGDSGDNNSRIVAALTTSLLTDPSTNVRVAAATALGRIAAPAALREAAERSIRSDSSPFVHTAWLAAIARLPAIDRNALIKILLSRSDLDPVVRTEAKQRATS